MMFKIKKNIKFVLTKLNYNCDNLFYIISNYILWFVGLNIISNVFKLSTFVLKCSVVPICERRLWGTKVDGN